MKSTSTYNLKNKVKNFLEESLCWIGTIKNKEEKSSTKLQPDYFSFFLVNELIN